MTIPKVEAYPLPNERELPANRVGWRIDSRRAVLLVHDLQDYFLDFYGAGSPLVQRLLENVSQLRRACKSAGVPVVYTAQPHEQSPEKRGLLNDMWGPGITAFPNLSPIAESIAPEAGDNVFTKWRYSAFAKTQLLSWLRASRRDQLLICGVYAHIGCQTTACDAFMADIQPFLIADAVADFSRSHHDRALGYVAGCCGVVTCCARSLEAVSASACDSNNSTQRQATGETDARAGAHSAENAHAQELGLVLRRKVCDLLGCSEAALDDEENLLDIGLDSVRLMTLVEHINALGVPIDFVDLAERPTLAAWRELIEQR